MFPGIAVGEVLQARGHDVAALHACRAGVALVALFVVVIGGRVIPMFTANAIPGFRLWQYQQVDRMVIPATVLGLASSDKTRVEVAELHGAMASRWPDDEEVNELGEALAT